MYIAGSRVPQDDGMDLRGDFLVQRHPRNCRDIPDFCPVSPFIITDRALRLEEPGTAGNTDRLERRADRQTYRLIAAALIRHQKVGRKGVESSGMAFTAGIETTSYQ